MILIKNAEIPESCSKCRIRRITEDMNGDYLGICPFLSRRVLLRTGQREKDCPISELSEYEEAMITEFLSEKDRTYIVIKEQPIYMESFKEALRNPSAASIAFDEAMKKKLNEDRNGSQQD